MAGRPTPIPALSSTSRSATMRQGTNIRASRRFRRVKAKPRVLKRAAGGLHVKPFGQPSVALSGTDQGAIRPRIARALAFVASASDF